MRSKKNAFILLVLLIITVLLPRTSHSAEEPAPAGAFFDIATYTKELKQKADRVFPGIVFIIAYNATGEESGSGSGFYIDSEGRILTNAIVLKDAYSAEVFSRSAHYTDVVILGRSEPYDLALISVKAINENPIEFDFEYKVRPGEKIMVVSRSRKMEKAVSEGLVSTLKTVEGGPELIKIESVPTLSFQSAKDGPVLNSEGKVIGIITSRNLENPLFGLDAMVIEDKLTTVSASSFRSFLAAPAEAEPLHAAKTRDLLELLKKTAASWFIVLYTMGFTKIVYILIATVLLISLVQWLYYRVKKKKQPQV